MADGSATSTDTVTTDPRAWEEAEAQLTAAWDVRGIELGTVQIDHKGTAVATGRRRMADGDHRIATLPSLLAPGPAGSEPQFQMGGVLGEGGMGIVRVARQTALDRDVAVKSLKDGVSAETAGPQLLREGRVTGVLEHPNVVPVYALGRDNTDRPLLVMKRITGRSWAKPIEEASSELRRSDGYLREQLAILKQVALAVHYAHAKGIIHRDLKPENVMIGDFGEVYVVDWGIAVSMTADGIPGVPAVTDVAAIEGTPAYMAPEMAAGEGERIGERSDVYLLGAILHEVLTGDAPHDGRSLVACLTKAFASVPHDYEEWVPPELAGIAHQAMSRSPSGRFESTAAFADAIDAFLEHWSSSELTRTANGRLDELELLLATPADQDERHAESVYALFSECRFGFRLALQSWPDNEQAQKGLQRSLEEMIRFELSRKSPGAAASWLRELPAPNPSLAAEIADAEADHKRTQERLAGIAHDVDLTLGRRLRATVGIALAVLYGGFCIGSGLLSRSGVHQVTHFEFGALMFGLAVIVLISVVARRDTLMANAANRRLVATAMIVFVAYTGIWTIGHFLQLSMLSTAYFHSFFGAAIWLAGTVSVEPRWWPIAVGSMVALACMIALPTYFFEWTGTFGVVGSILSNLYILRGSDDDESEQAPG
jgi:eukaryotic-like serine/threonine-protein kinase